MKERLVYELHIVDRGWEAKRPEEADRLESPLLNHKDWLEISNGSQIISEEWGGHDHRG